jgi:iron(III) transport system substrate-binding protein
MLRSLPLLLGMFLSLAMISGCEQSSDGQNQESADLSKSAEPSGGADKADSPDAVELAILTPHHDTIQQEFERGFNAYVGREVKIRWVKQGTRQLMQLLHAQDEKSPGTSFQFDLLFGGGAPDHELAAQRGYLEKPTISEEILAAIPDTIGGVANKDDEGYWYGTAVAAFGILTNPPAMKAQNLPQITTWEDLSKPEFLSWIVLADPRKSSSVRACYELVLQQHGWEQGWADLMAMSGNARHFTSSSSQIPQDVGTGNVVAGPCIDFYGWTNLAKYGKENLEYILPKGGYAITPDPIAMLRKPPHRELAEKFIEFVMSEAGQRLWILPAGSKDGPTDTSLYRLAVLPSVYEKYADEALTPNPYAWGGKGLTSFDAKLEGRRTELLAELMGVAVVDLHNEAKAAWKALVEGGMKPEALAEWNAVPFDYEQSLAYADELRGAEDAKRVATLRREWQKIFREKYRAVIRLAN